MKIGTFILTGILIFCLAAISLADAVIKSKTTVEIMGMGTTLVNTVQYLRNDRSCDVMSTTISGMMGMGGTQKRENSQIVRLDKGLIWVVQPDAKIYNEIDMAQLKSQHAQMEKETADPKEEEYEWTVEISKDIKSETINNFKCKKISGRIIGASKKDVKDSVFIDYQQWFGSQKTSGMFKEFMDKYAALTGLKNDFLSQMSSGPMMADYADQFEELFKALENMEGMPIKTILVIEQSTNPMGAMMGDQEMDKETAAMMQKMGMSPGKPEGGHHKIMSMENEVIEVGENSVADNQYEIPEGYTKQ